MLPIDEVGKAATDMISVDINKIIPWYILGVYAKVVEKSPILSEPVFDKIKRTLIVKWDTLQHKHKECITITVHKDKDEVKVESFPTTTKSRMGQLRNAFNIKKEIT